MDDYRDGELQPLSAGEVERLRQLAARVEADLSRSGLVLRGSDEEQTQGGVEVELDEFDDAAGGLWLHWRLHPSFRQRVREAIQDGRTDSPLVQASGQVYERMADVIVDTLKALGYEAEHSDDDYRVYAVRVLAGPS